MSKAKNKVYPKEGEHKLKEANRSLKSKVKQLTKKVSDLEAVNEQLQEAFLRGIQQVSKATKKLEVEEVVKLVNDEEFTPKANKTKEDIVAEMRKRYGNKNNNED